MIWVLSLTFLNPVNADTAKMPTVNVLTWWGYLDNPEVSNIVRSTCHANISYDEYYSNAEFLRRFSNQKQNYDIIIFSNTIYNIIRNQIKLDNSSLWRQSDGYNKTIRAHYLSSKYPPNIVYFEHSLTGFLWNPELIHIASNDSIADIFHKADNNPVILVDDPVEAAKLLSMNASKDGSPINIGSSYFDLDNFKKLIQNSDVYITNQDDSSLIQEQKFAFAFYWSGDAILIMKQSQGKVHFFIHPKLSYVTTDLLAQLNNKPYVGCVASVLSSNKVLSIIQNKDYYFSPYTNTSQITDPLYKKVYMQFITELPKLSWLQTVSSDEFSRLNNTWELIKIYLKKQNNS